MIQKFLQQRAFSTKSGITMPTRYNIKHNPIIFNVINEKFVTKGKEKIVGMWLATVSASIFAIVVIGGHTRLTKSGLSMVRW